MTQNSKEYKQEYYKKNKARLLARQIEYYAQNKEARLEYAQSYYQNNQQALVEVQKEQQKNNRVEATLYHNEYVRARSKNDPSFKLRNNVSAVIYSSLINSHSSKRGQSVMLYLSYSIQELKEHLENQFEPWMSWNNHGTYNSSNFDKSNPSTWTWNIDHIIAQSKLPYISMEDDNFKKCWALSNLRPLLSKINLEKGNK